VQLAVITRPALLDLPQTQGFRGFRATTCAGFVPGSDLLIDNIATFPQVPKSSGPTVKAAVDN
jgi:hypothetical protein